MKESDEIIDQKRIFLPLLIMIGLTISIIYIFKKIDDFDFAPSVTISMDTIIQHFLEYSYTYFIGVFTFFSTLLMIKIFSSDR